MMFFKGTPIKLEYVTLPLVLCMHNMLILEQGIACGSQRGSKR